MKFPLLQHHHREECIKRIRVSRVNKTLICTVSSLRTLGAILLSGTRVGVCGVTLEHFYPHSQSYLCLQTTMETPGSLHVQPIIDWIMGFLRQGR